MQPIKIKFVDLPGEFNKYDNFIVNLLKERYEVEFSDEPDFLFYSVFGIEYLAYPNCVRIFLDGEPVLPNFNDCDYAIGYTYMDFGERYLRVAGLLASSVGEELPRKILDRSAVSEEMFDRKFCNFIYSNDVRGEGSRIRVDFCKELMKYKHVDCPGKILNNMSSDVLAPRYLGFDEGGNPIVHGNDWQTSKLNFQSQYKFTIAFENLNVLGMTTEKMINPLMAYSIPIYWGNSAVAKEFNPKAFIDCNEYGNDFKAVIERVKELDNDKEQYLDMLRQCPILPDYDFGQRDKLREFLYKIIERGNHPVRNPEAVNCWEPVSANLVLRWGNSYQEVHAAICREDTNTMKIARKLQQFGDSKWGKIPKKLFHLFLRIRNKIKER